MEEVINQFEPKSEFVYNVKRNGIIVIPDTEAPSADGYIIKDLMIPANTTLEYTFTYHFVETGVNQDNQKGKTFSSKIIVEAN